MRSPKYKILRIITESKIRGKRKTHCMRKKDIVAATNKIEIVGMMSNLIKMVDPEEDII